MMYTHQTKLESFIPRHQLNSIIAAQLFSELYYCKPTRRPINDKRCRS